MKYKIKNYIKTYLINLNILNKVFNQKTQHIKTNKLKECYILLTNI